jgi:hypothetical protein
MNQEKFDEMFDEAFEAAAKKHDFVPDSEASWEKVQKRLIRRYKRKQFFKALPYIAASFVLGAFLFGTPITTKAFTPFFQNIKAIQQNVVSLIFGSDEQTVTKPKTSPPNEAPHASSAGHDVNAGETAQFSYTTWEEASSNLAFRPPNIMYIPDGFKISNVLNIVPHGTGKATTSIVNYANSSGKNYSITFRLVERNEKITSGLPKDGGKYEEIKINDAAAFLYETNDGSSSIEFMSGGIYICVLGNLSKAETQKVAQNIK